MKQHQPGSYAVTRTHGFFGYLIRIVTLSKWNHAFVIIGGGEIVEARTTGVTVSPENIYAANSPVNDWDHIDSVTRSKIVDAARSYVGRPYNFLDILALAMVQVVGLHWGWLVSRVAREDRMICSQVVAQSYFDAGVDLFPGVPPQLVTPAMLANRLIEGQ